MSRLGWARHRTLGEVARRTKARLDLHRSGNAGKDEKESDEKEKKEKEDKSRKRR